MRCCLLLLTAILSIAAPSTAQTEHSLSCTEGTDKVLSCTINEVPLRCQSATGAWSEGPLQYYPGWYIYNVESQDAQGNLTGYYDDGWDPSPLPLYGHYDVTTGRGWFVVDWPGEYCFDGGACDERTEFTLEPPGCNSWHGRFRFDDGTWDLTYGVKPATIPSGSPAETTSFIGWAAPPYDTRGMWEQRLYPLTTSFDGRAVEEET